MGVKVGLLNFVKLAFHTHAMRLVRKAGLSQGERCHQQMKEREGRLSRFMSNIQSAENLQEPISIYGAAKCSFNANFHDDPLFLFRN